MTWNRQKAKKFILKAADQIYEIIEKGIEIQYPSQMVFSGIIRYTKDEKLHLHKLWECLLSIFLVFTDQLITLITKIGKQADDYKSRERS